MSKRLIAALLAAVCVSSYAGGVFRSRDVIVRLSDKACEGMPAQLIGEDAKSFRAAEVVYQGRPIPACWTLKEDKVLLVDADGDAGYIMASEFKVDGA